MRIEEEGRASHPHDRRDSFFEICFSISSEDLPRSDRMSNLETPVELQGTPQKRNSDRLHAMVTEEEDSLGKSPKMESQAGNTSTRKRNPVYVEVKNPLEGRRLF